MVIESSSTFLLVCQLSESLSRLFYCIKGNQEIFRMVGYKVYKLEGVRALVCRKLGGVMMYLSFGLQ